MSVPVFWEEAAWCCSPWGRAPRMMDREKEQGAGAGVRVREDAEWRSCPGHSLVPCGGERHRKPA